MKLIEFEIQNKKVLLQRNLIGTETISVDGEVINKKWNLFNTNHNFRLNNKDYNFKYIYKNGWKKIIGTPTFQLSSNDSIVSEYKIKNIPYLTFQFGLGLLITYVAISLLFLLIESAKRGFVFDAH